MKNKTNYLEQNLERDNPSKLVKWTDLIPRTWILMWSLLLMTGCGTYYYYPTFQHVPTNNKSNEIQAEYFVSSDNRGLFLGYTILDNMGTFVNYSDFTRFGIDKKTHMLDLGLYYYKSNLIDNSPEVNVNYSLSTAYGMGEHFGYSDYIGLHLTRLYLQPGIAISSKFLDIGFSTRLSRVDHKITNIYTDPGQRNSYLEEIQDVGKEKFYFAEPNILIGLGYKGIKLNYHLVNLKKLNESKIKYYNEPVGYISLSIKYDFSKFPNF